MMYWSRRLKIFIFLTFIYDANGKISTILNENQDLNRNTADQCDSLNKLNDIVGSQSEIIPGWTNDGLDAGPWKLPKWDYVWEVCGKDEAWYGWKLNSGVGSISTTLTASGSAKLYFGNCWAFGSVKVYLDDIEIASAGPAEHKTVAFDFQIGAVLSIHDEGENSIIQISKFEILTCDVAPLSTILVIAGFHQAAMYIEGDMSPEVINLEGKTCSRLPDPVYAPGGANGAFINDQLVICARGECFSLKKGDTTWNHLGNLKSGVGSSGSSSVVINNTFYVIGGVGSTYEDCSTIKTISLNGETSIEPISVNGDFGDPLETSYCWGDHVSVTINRTTSITIGGAEYMANYSYVDQYKYAKRTYYFDGKTFSEGPDLITGRKFAHAAGLLIDKETNDEYIVVVGGKDEKHQYLDSVELLKIGDSKWKPGNPLPMKLFRMKIVTIGGDIIVIGGVPDDDQCLPVGVCKALYKFSCKSGNCQWTTLPQSLEFSRTDMVALAIPDDFFDCK